MCRFIIVILFFLITSCKTDKNNVSKELLSNDFDFWHLKDFEKDSLPGISLTRLEEEILKNKKGDEVIVAIIDTKINTNHEDLIGYFWVNKKEIENNDIDDDKNGYVDDKYGWNFIGNSNGDQLINSSNSHIKVLKAYDGLFKGKKLNEIGSDTIRFNEYQRALRSFEKEKGLLKSDFEYAEFLSKGYPRAKKIVDSIFNNDKYTVKQLNSLYNILQKKNDTLANQVYFMYDFIRYDMFGEAESIFANTKLKEKISNNVNYNHRAIIGDNYDDINDRKYGNNIVNDNLNDLTHGTTVAGVLIGNRNNNVGVIGMNDNIKVMPISIQPKNGDEFDKDIALGIRYAVDNGAKVISYSSIKYFSLHSIWVQEALKYADEKDVIFVRAAGNQSNDTDKVITFPNDDDKNYILSNFIVVGAIGKDFQKPWWSNYGKETVDLFAPGVEIPTTDSSGGYKTDSGTSMATPLVAGVAAILYSYYPDLSAKAVKNIILESSVKHNIDVVIREDPELILKYEEISKTGGFLNAYYAFKLAEVISSNR